MWNSCDRGPIGDTTAADVPAAALFAILWARLADVLGSAATAALVRRAARGATGRCPELAALIIVREELCYRWSVPTAWNDRGRTLAPLRELVHELRPLLVEMTGSVVIRHLASVPELGAAGFPFLTEEEQP